MRNKAAIVGCCVTALLVAARPSAGIGDGRLIEAIRNRNARAVAALLKQRVDVNVSQPDGATPLHWAVHLDDVQTVDLLITAGANTNAMNDYGVMPLFLAATNGSASIIGRLLKAGANSNAALPNGVTALMAAARTGRIDAVKELLAHGADVNAKHTSKGQTALMWAVAEQHLPVARLLIEHGADVRARTLGGFTPMLFAARERSIDIVRLFLTRGLDINESSTDGSTPLLVATVRGHVELAKYLLEHGAMPDGDAEGAGFTPLHWAAGKSEGVITFDYPNAPGEWAALAGIPSREDQLALIKMLVARGANVNARLTKDLPRYGKSLYHARYLPGATPFYLAAAVADIDVIRLLLASGADPNMTAKDKTPPLMVAAGLVHANNESRVTEAEHVAATKFLLDLGAHIHAKNNMWQTVAHGAAYAGFNDVIQLLADKGAKLSEIDTNGESPLGITEGKHTPFFFEHPHTAALLRKLGAVPGSGPTKPYNLYGFDAGDIEKPRRPTSDVPKPSAAKTGR